MAKLRIRSLLLPALIFSFTFARAQDAAPAAAPAAPVKEWTSTAGASAIVNTGNAVNQTFGGNALIDRKWDKNQVGWTAQGAYGRAKDPATGDTNTNTKNWKTALRYDRFLLAPLSIYEMGHVGQDKPAGFDLRYGGSAGAAHIALDSGADLFKYEAGYDFTREQRVDVADASIHSARFFLRYQHKFSEAAVFAQDVESLFNLRQGEDIRLNTLTSVTVKLTDKVAFQTGFGVRFDNQPVAGFKKTDTTTQAGLVLSFL